ncbi:HelD family protein [Embleya sp. NBC_00896]|uniref:HelD family protein n=1 Tax=Embleya sp. NBC_00896 TaxID=2975961 RepID=UPI003869EF3E|nr:AAA family ATPase [Embleya sp. NBC_00896]
MSVHASTPGSAVPNPDALPDDALAVERAYLDASRAALRRMREETEALDLRDVGATAVANETAQHLIAKRIAALADHAGSPLFFGRVDGRFADGVEGVEPVEVTADPSKDVESFWIGRRHVHDELGDPMVVDWRAPLSRAFYRANRVDPLGVELRRRFGWTAGELTAFEDEHLTDAEETDTASGILAAEIERPRVGPMRDIVATIQPEQDEIVRSDLGHTLCVQGAPGTGKTAVGLHRVAWLLYAYRDRLARTGTLVVGPNRSFLDYIQQVLPALGEVEVGQTTVEDLVTRTSKITIRALDEAVPGTVKGDARMAEVLRRAVWSGLRDPQESVAVVRDSRTWRLAVYEIEELVTALRTRDVRYGAARDMLRQRLAHALLSKMEERGESPDDRVQDAVARSRPVKAAVDAMWPAVDPLKLVFRLLSDAAFLAACADGILTADEQAAILWAKPPRGAGSARWTVADAVLVDETADLLYRTGGYGHVVIDEAQDLSPMQCRAVGRRCSTGSATVLGDIAQGTTPWATPGWEETLRHLGHEGAKVEELTRGFRVPLQILEFASRLLPLIAPELSPASSVRRTAGALELRAVEAEELSARAAAAAVELLDHEGSIGLICADERVPSVAAALRALDAAHRVLGGDGGPGEARISVVPASLAKGLEFDHVAVAEPAEIVDAEAQGLRRLYVVLTRAVSGLVVLHGLPLPDALSSNAGRA